MKKITFKSLVIFMVCIAALCFQSCDKEDSTEPTVTTDNSEFKAEMRYLWADHAVWTRDVIVGILDQNTRCKLCFNKIAPKSGRYR